MAFFRKNKKNEQSEKHEVKRDDALREDISKAYDEIMNKSKADTEGSDKDKSEQVSARASFENEVLKMKIREFKEKKTQESLVEVIKLLPKRIFLLPSVSNLKEPFESVDGKLQLKKGAVLHPALLNDKNNTSFLPMFTDEKSMTQKSPSGIVLRLTTEQCVSIIYDKNNPAKALAINPFTENMIVGEELLRQVFLVKENKN